MAERDSAAKRRRDRRLRMHWRHEQLTLRMALAAALHHSRDVGSVTYNALRNQRTSVAGETEFFSLYEEELGGTRPERLAGVRPQVRVLQHIVEQIVDPAEDGGTAGGCPLILHHALAGGCRAGCGL